VGYWFRSFVLRKLKFIYERNGMLAFEFPVRIWWAWRKQIWGFQRSDLIVSCDKGCMLLAMLRGSPLRKRVVEIVVSRGLKCIKWTRLCSRSSW